MDLADLCALHSEKGGLGVVVLGGGGGPRGWGPLNAAAAASGGHLPLIPAAARLTRCPPTCCSTGRVRSLLHHLTGHVWRPGTGSRFCIERIQGTGKVEVLGAQLG